MKQLHKGAWVYTNYTTDAYGNVTSVTDADNKTMNYVYGAEYGYAYPTEEWRTVNKVMVGGVETNGVRVSTSYGYDPFTGERTSVQDPNGNVTGYQYDVLGRLTKATFPKLSGETASAFKEAIYDDVANTKTTKNELGAPAKFYYDGLGRLWKTEQYVKDGSGNFTRRDVHQDPDLRRSGPGEDGDALRRREDLRDLLRLRRPGPAHPDHLPG